jgi:YidC/Oxa1 family membrane protein insertase
MIAGFLESAMDAGHEMAEMNRLFSDENKKTRSLVFYAESGVYYRYYEDYIEHILQNSKLDICYITSQRHDQIFQAQNARIKPFYIKNCLSAVFSQLDSKVLVLTVPDLNKGVVKRAPSPVHHIYVFHGVASTHQSFHTGAFDYYDTIFCIGNYHVDEIRKAEQVYGLKPKQLVVTGYPRIERIHRDHQLYLQEHVSVSKKRPLCLIAPTWFETARNSSLMENGIEELLSNISKMDIDVILRPHPEFWKRYQKRWNQIVKLIDRDHMKNVRSETNFVSMQTLHEADVLVTEQSSICFDFALGTERPVLFIETPCRVDNPEMDRIALLPVENEARSKLGRCLAPAAFGKVAATIEALLSEREEYKSSIPQVRNHLIANWQQGAKIGGDYIITLCSDG